MKAYKFAVNVPVTREELSWRYGGEWERKIKSRTETPPTAEDMAEYQRGCELLDQIHANKFYDPGYEEGGMSEPQPTVHIEYAETRQEWLDRIGKLDPAEYEAKHSYGDLLDRFMHGSRVLNALMLDQQKESTDD